MSNTLVHSSHDLASEPLTARELISNFKKVLMSKEDGTFPLYTDIQEAFHLLVSHMRVIDPLCASFMQARLKGYDGINSPGLQGYIRYIENEVIAPLEKPTNKSAALMNTIVRCHQIISLGEAIIKNKIALFCLRKGSERYNNP